MNMDNIKLCPCGLAVYPVKRGRPRKYCSPYCKDKSRMARKGLKKVVRHV